MQYNVISCYIEGKDSYEAVYDIIDDRVNGILVKPFFYRKYAKKLYKLCLDREKRVQMAKSGVASVNKFDSSVIINEWLSLFDKLMKNNG
ncbi:MAG: hypothetical protein R3Y59_01890 [bacterium]